MFAVQISPWFSGSTIYTLLLGHTLLQSFLACFILPDTHHCWAGGGSMQQEVCPTLLHMTSSENRMPDLLILSNTSPTRPNAPNVILSHSKTYIISMFLSDTACNKLHYQGVCGDLSCWCCEVIIIQKTEKFFAFLHLHVQSFKVKLVDELPDQWTEITNRTYEYHGITPYFLCLCWSHKKWWRALPFGRDYGAQLAEIHLYGVITSLEKHVLFSVVSRSGYPLGLYTLLNVWMPVANRAHPSCMKSLWLFNASFFLQNICFGYTYSTCLTFSDSAAITLNNCTSILLLPGMFRMWKMYSSSFSVIRCWFSWLKASSSSVRFISGFWKK